MHESENSEAISALVVHLKRFQALKKIADSSNKRLSASFNSHESLLRVSMIPYLYSDLRIPQGEKEEMSIVTRAFERLTNEYSGSELFDIKNQSLHINAIKEFWLGCYLSSGDLLYKLSEPVGRSTWVNLTLFQKCIQSSVSRKKALFGSENENKFEIIQLFLFFFCLNEGKLLLVESIRELCSLIASYNDYYRRFQDFVYENFEQMHQDQFSIEEIKLTLVELFK